MGGPELPEVDPGLWGAAADLVWLLFTLYVFGSLFFLVLDNRRPQSTLAWAFGIIFLPVVGLLAYLLFGRGRKAFARQRRLLRQDVDAAVRRQLAPVLEAQEEEFARLGGEGGIRLAVMNLVRRNSPSILAVGNEAEILQDAETFYPRMMEDMRRAQRSIHLQYFIWGADETTEEIRDVLLERAQAGVEVRLLYDPLGSMAHLRRGYLAVLREGGVKVFPTSPLWRLHTISYRNHRKITVIDGAVAYTGGMNIGHEHLSGGKGFNCWRDTQVRVAGPAAAVLQAVFLIDWRNSVGENLIGPEHFPPTTLQGRSGDVPVQIVTSGPDSRWAAIRQLYFFMIVKAQRHVFIQSPYFVLDSTIAEALGAAAMSGVDVQVMLSARASGNQLPEWAGNTYIMDVVKAGVKVFLYEKGYLHAKTISVDSELCSIGSANIDVRSFSINYELNAILYSAEAARRLEADFVRDLEHCAAFDPREYRRRNLALRFRDSAVRVLSPIL